MTATNPRHRIPRIIHVIWVGDESRRPDNCISTWKQHNPDWTVKIWGNAELGSRGWINAKHMRTMSKRELNGVADMMRWEILYEEGGFLVDADSVCTRPLDDWLLEQEAFACWENELVRPGLIAAGYVGHGAGEPVHRPDHPGHPGAADHHARDGVADRRSATHHRRVLQVPLLEPHDPAQPVLHPAAFQRHRATPAAAPSTRRRNGAARAARTTRCT